jgi:hypothetical protein
MFTDTFAGIEPSPAPAFVVAELTSTALAIGAAALLLSHREDVAEQVVIPHASD